MEAEVNSEMAYWHAIALFCFIYILETMISDYEVHSNEMIVSKFHYLSFPGLVNTTQGFLIGANEDGEDSQRNYK